MDVVGFVNGIPLMVMTCGRDGQAALGQGIGRQLQDQLPGAVPMLYAYAQLLLSVNAGDGVYGTTLSVPARWGRWREEEFGEAHFARLEKTFLPAEVRQALEAGRGDAVKMALRQLWPSQGTPDGLDRLLVGLLSPVRLLAFIRSYLVFDREKGKLAARCEQFFATRAVLTRISHRRIGGLRDGGILWHKNGTGKSMLLLFVANALLLQDSLKACRMVIIPDSTGLRDRLVAQFMKRDAFDPVTGMKKRKPKVLSGRNLANRIGSGSERVLIASVAKFTIAAELATCRNFSDNLIVLTEESPRRPMAENRRRLRKALPRSAWIAVSGEPLQADRVMGEFPGTLIHAYPLDDVGAGALRMEMRQPESQYTVGETPLASGLPEPAGAQPAVDFTEAGAAPASRQAAPAQEFLTGDQGPTEDGAAALARLSPTAWRVALPWLATGEQEAGDDAAGCDSQTRIIDEVVRAAVIANSLNPQNIEADIRRSLLPVLFGQVGMEKARQAIDDVLKILRAHFGRMAA
jgi:type I restriction enzyme R subunit